MGAMGSATANTDATVGENERAYFAERAKGGCGLIINEVTRVNHNTAVMMERQTSAAKDSCIPGLRNLANDVHYYGGAIFCQLHHPGRQSFYEINGGYPLPTPSGIISPITESPCIAMSRRGIERLVQEFIDAAERCYKAGIDGVELHAAHGYLLNQFLSPYTNRRTDDYGGNIQNRARVVKEIILGIRERVGRDYPVTLRITADEFLETSIFPTDIPGLKSDEAVEICKYLIPFGLDAISVTAGVYESMNTSWEPTSYPEGWKVYLAEKIKKAVNVPVFGVGVIRNPDFAEKAIADGKVDCVVIARGQMADPEWVNKTAQGRVEDIRRCISCLNCFETLQTSADTGEPVSCALNPRSAREWFFNDLKINGAGRPVVIVGGGPSGCEAARTLAERGFKVTLFEKSDKLGGQLNLANKPPHKDKINWAIGWYETQLRKLGVDVRLSTPATVAAIKALSPIGVFVGTGSESIVPRAIPGVDKANVATSSDVLRGTVSFTGKRAAVIGSGMTGLETAELIASQGNQVTVIEMADKIGPDASFQNLTDVQVRLQDFDVKFLPNHKLAEITDSGIRLETTSGDVSLDADYVVLSLGVRAQQDTLNEIRAEFPDAVAIGDTQKVGRIANAVHTAYRAAYKFRIAD
jgi:2,4-dienoyl-CoA reductase-like NADH-dependent reductase (Old Yellow Enzyme family)/thioredoxin reductase